MAEKIVSVESSLNPAPPSEIHDLTVAYHKKPVLWGIVGGGGWRRNRGVAAVPDVVETA